MAARDVADAELVTPEDLAESDRITRAHNERVEAEHVANGGDPGELPFNQAVQVNEATATATTVVRRERARRDLGDRLPLVKRLVARVRAVRTVPTPRERRAGRSRGGATRGPRSRDDDSPEPPSNLAELLRALVRLEPGGLGVELALAAAIRAAVRGFDACDQGVGLFAVACLAALDEITRGTG